VAKIGRADQASVESTVASFEEATTEKIQTWIREVEDELSEIQHSISVNLAGDDRAKWEALVEQECRDLKQKIADEQQQAPPKSQFDPTPFRPTRGNGRGKGRGKRSN
jgi:cob(I)alamin adenosyltransferase